MAEKLYHRENIFILAIGADVYTIAEPIKWDSIQAELVMDEQFFGYRYEFSDKDVMLEFDNSSGRDLIIAEYKAKGVDAQVSLKFGFIIPNTNDVEVLFEGDLNFEVYEETEYTIKLNVERRSIGQLLRTRFDSKVNLKALQTLDGASISTLQQNILFNYPTEDKRSGKLIYNTNLSGAQPTEEVPGQNRFLSVPPLKLISSNVEGLDSVQPTKNFLYSGFEFEAGLISRKIKLTGELRYKFTKTAHVGGTASAFVLIQRRTVTTGTLVEAYFLGYLDVPFSSGVQEFRIPFTIEFEMFEDENVLIEATFTTSGLFTFSDFEFIELQDNFLNVEEVKRFQSSTTKSLYLFDAINRQLNISLGQSNLLKSTLYGRVENGYNEDGDEAFNQLLDGKSIRNLNKPFNVSIKDLMTSLNALHNIGFSIERDTNNVESVRVERMEYFFQNILLHQFDFVSKYSRKPNLDLICNELEFGFTKFPRDNQQGSLGDYLTKMNYQTPVKNVKNKFAKVSEILLSTFYISYTQREAFANNPDNAYETDEDLFLIANEAPSTVFNGCTLTFRIAPFNDILITLPIGLVLALIEGDKFTVSAFSIGANNKQYEATSVSSFVEGTSIVYRIKTIETFSAGSGSGNVTLNIAEQRLLPKIANGTTQVPTGSYNPDFTIFDMLHNSSKAWRSGIKGTNNNLVFLNGSNNTSLDGNNYPLNNATFQPPLFGYDLIEFESKMDWATLNLIRKAFEGRHPENKNYGYFEFENPDGVVERGWLKSLKFNPVKEIVKIKVIEKI
jgi:hypothetical protein